MSDLAVETQLAAVHARIVMLASLVAEARFAARSDPAKRLGFLATAQTLSPSVASAAVSRMGI